MRMEPGGRLRRWACRIGRFTGRHLNPLPSGPPTDLEPAPSGPPIEWIAGELRRLLWQHDVSERLIGTGTPAKRLWALEAAITHRATQAARALDVPHPDPPAHRGFTRPKLRRLLRALAAEGLMLPPWVALMAPDSHP